MKLIVNTTFGCICCNAIDCRVCGKGRRYEIEIDNTKKVEAIWDSLCAQNELLKGYKPILQYEKEILDLERRILSYDILDNGELSTTLPPMACCKGPNRKAPKAPKEEANVELTQKTAQNDESDRSESDEKQSSV